MAPGKT